MNGDIDFFTATCLNWQNLLEPDQHKQVILSSLEFLVNDNRIWLYGYVIMPNHIHLLWRKQDAWIDKNIAQIFLKFTAQQIKFNLMANHPGELTKYKSSQSDRKYHFWERRPYQATMNNRNIVAQKLDYIHYNPVKKKLSTSPLDYQYSSARFYEGLEKSTFLTHYMEHIY
ncbi:REP-associated tyrosine transposase [Pedobacter nanyangensis]|uniref:REP-associated tyrosine transposase n=1 Tax=Pedobacter nanyangensis TaxID=1562389 RepID=UPI000DE56337|nr:transposase [Pedobacter nanyangensis]